MLGRLEAQAVLRLQIEHLEFQHRVERRPAALRPVHAAEGFVENRPEQLEVDDLQELLQRIALRGQLAKTLLDAPEPRLLRQATPPSPATLSYVKLAKSTRFPEASRCYSGNRHHGRGWRRHRRDRPPDRLEQGRGHGRLQPPGRAPGLGLQLHGRQALGPGRLRRHVVRRLPRHRRQLPPAALEGADLRHQPWAATSSTSTRIGCRGRPATPPARTPDWRDPSYSRRIDDYLRAVPKRLTVQGPRAYCGRTFGSPPGVPGGGNGGMVAAAVIQRGPRSTLGSRDDQPSERSSSSLSRAPVSGAGRLRLAGKPAKLDITACISSEGKRATAGW